MAFVITIDQGTTGSRVFIIDEKGQVVSSAYEEFTQHFPRPGWVEHDVDEIWGSLEKLIEEAINKAGVKAEDTAGIGITNQRETTVVWQKGSAKPVHHAIVWQCRRTAPYCHELKKQNLEQKFREKTGLVIDAYFSGTKIRWILENVEGARAQADAGELLFGTIDSYLLYKLTSGDSHKTDYTNASRTLIYNIHSKSWDDELLKILNIPASMLPEVQASASDFGKTRGLKCLPDGIPVYSMVGDQQSALFGQLCVEPGQTKNTYGTGCFMLMNLGDKPLTSEHGLVTTLACDAKGGPVYCLEGSVFIAGAVVQYLRDSLGFFQKAEESETLAKSVSVEDDGVVFVPAFAGLGAPYWDQDARGAIFGLTRDTTPAQITRAALKSIALQSYDLQKAMEADSNLKLEALAVDGGATKNAYLMEYQAGLLGVPVHVPKNIETTVLGAAYLCGLKAGIWKSIDELKDINPMAATYHPHSLSDEKRERELGLWADAIKKVLTT